MQKLPKNFYLQDAFALSKKLLGKYLVHDSSSGKTIGKIVETEAYMGEDDPASHTYGKGITERTKIQYKEGGYAYIYQIYGMYFCLNIVCGERDVPHCVHIRALEPVEGIEIMKKRRKYSSGSYRSLTNGPAKLCQAMGITKELYGENLCGNKLYLLEDSKIDSSLIISTPRAGIDYAGEAKHYPWRFFIRGNEFVSRVKV
jgi:DNA-3-methyladenine glycosylase